MPKGPFPPALVKAIAITALLAAAACTPPSYPGYPIPRPLPLFGQQPADALNRLAADIAQTAPDTELLAAAPGSSNCGPVNTPVVRGLFPERVLFATASDQPAADAAGTLKLLADLVSRDAPGSELTVLGHTDAVGSDAYNMDLSRRRALTVLRALAADGLAADHLSAVAIGKRQPIDSNDTPEGRARNRRVEFLISGCLAANLGAVRAQPSPGFGTNTPVDVMRLSPSAEQGLATVDRVSLRQPEGDQPISATLAPAPSLQPPALQPPATVARPAPAPHYQPKTLSPAAQRNPLGPAVPF